MTFLSDPNGGPRGQNILGLGAQELQKPLKIEFFYISNSEFLAFSAPNEILFWDYNPSL